MNIFCYQLRPFTFPTHNRTNCYPLVMDHACILLALILFNDKFCRDCILQIMSQGQFGTCFFLLIAFVCNEVFFLSEQNVEGKACKLKITVRHFYHFHMVSW